MAPPLIPRHFSRLQVAAIIMFLLMVLYTFRTDINTYLDQENAYSVANPQIGQWFMTTLLILAFVGLAGMGFLTVYWFKIEPMREKKLTAKMWRARLERNRPQMNLLETNMESFSIMVWREQHPERVIYLLGVGRK